MINSKAVFIFLVLFPILTGIEIVNTSIAGGADTEAPKDAKIASKHKQYAKELFDRYKPLKCKKSKSPLFRADPSDLLKLEIISNFNRINTDTYDEEGGDSGVISYVDRVKTTQYVPVFIKDRGNSRRDSCEWVPLRIKFESPRIKEELDRSLEALPQEQDRLVSIYNELGTRRKDDPLLKGTSQKNNIFRKLGDDIKIVTHCGKSTWKRVGGDAQEQQENRLLLEYYIYQVLDQTRSTILKTRLAEITYKDPTGNVMLTRKAFFREPNSKLAKRCGLSHKSPQGIETKDLDEVSSFQLDLFNNFVYSKDYDREEGLNIIYLYGKEGQ